MKPFLLLALLATSIPAADTYFPPPDSEGGWREAKTAKEVRDLAAMDLSKLESAFTLTDRSTANGGLVVVHNGYLCFERYFGRASRNSNPDMASTGKAFCSIACGIMLNEFKDKIPQGLDTKVFTEKYLPEAFPLNDPRKADILLGQLLSMSAGYWGEGQTPTGYVKGDPKPKQLKPVPGQNIKDLDKSSLNVPLWTDPGAGYSYSSPSPHIASIVLRNVSGMELKDYINERLAKPQGWGAWDYCLHRGDFEFATQQRVDPAQPRERILDLEDLLRVFEPQLQIRCDEIRQAPRFLNVRDDREHLGRQILQRQQQAHQQQQRP